MAASNWHWRTREVRPWAESWLNEKITPLESEGISITRVTAEGDCELGHRKGRLLTIYDMRIECLWQAKSSDGETIKGLLTCPEMAHDMEVGAYQFETSITSGSGSEADKFRAIAQKQLADSIRPIFGAFPQAMLDTHGQTLKAPDTDSAASSGRNTPISLPAGAAAVNGGRAASAAPVSTGESLNTSMVRVRAEFMATAEDLFDLLTNAERVPMWSRNPAKIAPVPGADIALFNGNITGRITEVERPNRFVSTWRAPTWPPGHYGQLATILTQGSDSTTMELRLTGVPKGQEEAVESNLDVFYIRSLKSIGLATPSRAHAVPRAHFLQAQMASLVYGGLPFLLSAALIVGLASAIYLGPTGGAQQ